ncbi:hypothetical protein SAMN02927937_02600 [Paenimyroides aquimaris]|uniref:DUF3300 domain-containing protein n=1 Tax=Paenimyroides marinum TaxID=1159016 RepID=A0A1H6MNP3_9FLAO|nr:hypothetical protein [Paenimyroides aquimaris]SEH99306.1 hypothetical protein SAMN02927937_02600 [Paenimyroides aquimaris]
MKIFKFALIAAAILTASVGNAQYNSSNATVVAQNYDISDNLDLQAVASIFGESRDLEDFERRLNDPSTQISNLDLNNDNYVDYLRVVEVGESDVRVIVIQAVLGQDMFQDVATIEIERQRNKTVQVQIVGNSYIYGPNYIYEPYYYTTPVFFDMFWLATYRPYYSPWYWGYYPTYYSYWRPMPVFRYHSHIYSHIDRRNRYSYTDNRRLVRADRMYSNVRGNSLERQKPNRSFASRNENVTNRRALETSRGTSRSNTLQTTNRVRTTGTRDKAIQNSRVNNSNKTSTINSGRQRVSTEEFSRSRSNVNSNVNRSTIQTSRNSNSRLNSSTNSRTISPSNSRIERSSKISSQPSRSISQPSSSRSSSSNISRSSAPTMSRSSAPTMSRSSAPSMSRSSGSMSSGRSSSGSGMSRSR